MDISDWLLTSLQLIESAAVVHFQYYFDNDVKDDPAKEQPGTPVGQVRLVEVHADEDGGNC